MRGGRSNPCLAVHGFDHLEIGAREQILQDLRRALRDPRERLLVQPGDVLVLQELPSEALSRYFTRTFFNFSLAWQAVHSRFASGVVDISAPERIPNRIGIQTLGNR